MDDEHRVARERCSLVDMSKSVSARPSPHFLPATYSSAFKPPFSGEEILQCTRNVTISCLKFNIGTLRGVRRPFLPQAKQIDKVKRVKHLQLPDNTHSAGGLTSVRKASAE